MKYIFVLATCLVLTGCTSVFYNNGPVDATPIAQSLSLKNINASNAWFNVYLVDSRYYALRPKRLAGRDIVDEINTAIIFSDEQISALRDTCREIISTYNDTPKVGANVIEYHLVSNVPEIIGSGFSYVNTGWRASTASAREIHRVIFRLQFTAHPRSVFSSRKTIRVMYRAMISEISINDLKNLLSDLERQ